MVQLLSSGRLQLMPPDPELVRRAQERDARGQPTPDAKAAFEALYQHYRNPIYNFLCYTMTSQHDAEDVVEEAFTNAWEALPKKKPEAPFHLWLMRIVLNERSKLRRWLMRWHPLGYVHEEQPTNLEAETARQDVLMRTWKSLTQKQRTILYLHYEMGCAHAEIAEIMHIKVGSVPMTLSRASQHFRKCYQALEKEE
jgi:RNA polymerase sigma-70 factor (ECF subfamily)